MQIENWLQASFDVLKDAGIRSARLDTLILVEDETGKDRAWLLAHPEYKLSAITSSTLNRKISRRSMHEPLAYIRGRSEFYGRTFKVNKHVLEPRPESETMIDLLLKLPLHPKVVIADVGTGSGALGITARLELSGAEVDLYDIDASALGVAKHNCELHELYLKTYKKDLLSRPARNYQIILANLPYVPTGAEINPAASFEPKIALYGGTDGLDLYRRLFKQLAKLKLPPQFVLTEATPSQHEALSHIASESNYIATGRQDFIQVFAWR